MRIFQLHDLMSIDKLLKDQFTAGRNVLPIEGRRLSGNPLTYRKV
jgi:hypothetical protein